MRPLTCAVLAAAALGSGSNGATAQTYPARTVRLVIPFPAGGGTDGIGRLFAAKLSESLGQQVVVENRAGASGIIGTEAVARAEPDGYVLLWAPSTHTTVPATTAKLPYDPIAGFTAIAHVANSPLAVVVPASLPARTIQELVALSKARPGALNFGSAGNGSINHLAGELFNARSGASLTHVAYKGLAPATIDLIAGRVEAMFASIPSVQGPVKQERLRALATSGGRRAGTLPEVPTLIETGYAGFQTYVWWGVMGPARLPRDIVARVNGATQAVLDAADLKNRLALEGAEPAPGTPEQFAAFVQGDLGVWRKLVADAGIRVE
jgi:tripartite-type tricarboxylate transporter receptor subunit TctC